MFFAYGVSKGMISRNPFDSRLIPTTAPRSKQKNFLAPDAAQAIMDNLPSAQWRLLLSLARWGGMRVPSEPKALRWEDIDVEKGRINFRSPKTEHHDGGDRRELPIFPELVAPLQDAYELAEPGEPLVLPWLTGISGTALCKSLIRAIKAAHLKPWPKLWTAIRASRTTELRQHFPGHVVDAWVGHDDAIARKHYTQILDTDFQKGNQFCASTALHTGHTETQQVENLHEKRTPLHAVTAKWAMRGSNPRHPRCKRGALAN